MVSPPSDLTTLLHDLAAAGVDFVVVGALAAVAQGAPITTHDVDIVHERSPANVDRLLAFLASVGARYRGRPGGQVLVPTREALLGTGHHFLMTASGSGCSGSKCSPSSNAARAIPRTATRWPSSRKHCAGHTATRIEVVLDASWSQDSAGRGASR
jgi:hypothetical protein